MDLRHLRYFQAVAEELSFSRAAVRLRVAQPALSRAVQELENDVGTTLLERNRRSVQLTPAGRVLLQETALILDRLQEALLRVRRTAAGDEGELRLGYIGPPTKPFLGRILAEFRKRHPRVSVHLEERTPERVWEMVARGRLSAGFARPVLAHEALGLETLTLRNERLIAVVPPGHPLARSRAVSWSQLASEPVVILARREGAGSHDAILAACLEAGFAPKIAHAPSVIGTVLRYVEAGAGIGIVPEGVASESEESDLVFVPLKPAHHVPLVFVWARRGEDPAVSAFRELLGNWLASGTLWATR